ncbi:endonuclease VII domain-containing protein [Streptomyces canus]|uniref:endonuclease VII domain-containing protein n=1 Tax=Streptomyces canus TaxID=58343 RepID=UPI00386E6801
MWRPVSEYSSSPVLGDGLSTTCKPCGRLTNYNVTPERFAAMLEAQGGVCAVCLAADGSGRELSVDHDHRCCSGPRSCGRCVRGLLCTRCNLGLGRLGDSSNRVGAALQYLRHWRAQPARIVADNPPKPRGRRWPRFRVTDAEYDRMLELQSGSCALCPRIPGRRALAVDHDHACCPTVPTCGGCVRGLLCTNCNVGLSHFREDEGLLTRAGQYLARAASECT